MPGFQGLGFGFPAEHYLLNGIPIGFFGPGLTSASVILVGVAEKHLD
jgi:hypothetical protein